jgi:hypothetical protein
LVGVRESHGGEQTTVVEPGQWDGDEAAEIWNEAGLLPGERQIRARRERGRFYGRRTR